VNQASSQPGPVREAPVGDARTRASTPEPVACYTREDHEPLVGRSRVIAVCDCGSRNLCYLWSWAGHGFKRCHSCGRRLPYQR
jgi:hypothetical protein